MSVRIVVLDKSFYLFGFGNLEKCLISLNSKKFVKLDTRMVHTAFLRKC